MEAIYDHGAVARHWRGYWDALWFRIAAQSWIQEARAEFSRLAAEYDKEPEYYYFEGLAREVSYECSPVYIYDIEGLAELCPHVWEKADELDNSWAPGSEYEALRWAIAYLIFEELFDLLPEG